MPDLLQEAMSAKQSGDITLAKQFLSQTLIQDPNNESAWILMSEVVTEVRLRRNCLERVLAINPNNNNARAALNKLNTSPLPPITRGERDKPLNPPTYEKIPPFTPPSTWGGDREQYPALNDLTYPELAGVQLDQPADNTPTFDWANDSEEPDKTIDKIFNAVSNPEGASQPAQDLDVDWLEDNPAEVLPNTAEAIHGNNISIGLDELVETEVPPLPEQSTEANGDFTVSAEPEFGLDAFIDQELPEETVTSGNLLWDNPKAKRDRLVILRSATLIYANPKETDIPHIVGLFNENRMLRDLLGEDAGVIKLENIRRLSANPKKADLTVEYKNKENKKSSHKLIFSTPQVRDECLTAILIRPGVEFHKTIQTFPVQDKIVPPLALLVFLIFLGWVLFSAVPMLSTLPGTQLGIFQAVVAGMQSFISSVGNTTLILILAACGLLALLWLVSNLMKPTQLIILEPS